MPTRAPAGKPPAPPVPGKPSPPGKRCITPEGHADLRDELDRLWRIERPRVTQEVSDAAAMGDRSENAEYIYGKKRLREIDRRLRYLSGLLDRLTVVSTVPTDPSQVFFGAWVVVEDAQGEQHRYRLVGPDEIDVKAGKVSVEAPLGRALLRKEVGDELVVVRPKGRARFTVIAISYESGPTRG